MINEARNKGQLIGLTISYHFIEDDDEFNKEFVKGVNESIESFIEKYKKNPLAAKLAARTIMHANGADMKGM